MLKLKPKNSEYCQHIIDLLAATQKAIRKIGYENLIKQILRVAENSDHPLRKELEVNILKYVSEEFNVTVEDILNSAKRGNEATARKITFILFKKQFDLSEYRIAKYFNRSSVIINRAVHEFNKYDKKYKADRIILDKYNSIVKKINIFKQETDYNNIIEK